MNGFTVILSVAALSVASLAQASSLDVNLRNEAVELSASGPVNLSGLNFSLSGLHHERDRDLISLGVSVTEELAEQSFVGLGGKLFAVDLHHADGNGLAIGGFFRYALPSLSGFGFGGGLYFSPDVTSFGDVDNYIEAAVRMEYQIMSTANVYLGYRYIDVNLRSSDEGRVDKGAHFGLRLDY
ncbi:MAG: YfaZ family protein [Gammaproteobacteria bacterium]|nr:YfaZ family protein [Gammaproteobacteria bacterium]